jgi:hypothetical protein
MQFAHEVGILSQQLTNPAFIKLSPLPPLKPDIDVFYKIESKNSTKYLNKTNIKNVLIDIFYDSISKAEDNTLYGIMLDGLEHAKQILGFNNNEVEFALKGGGACRFYSNQFYNRINQINKDTTHSAAVKNIFSEKISDIDVGLIYHGITRKQAEQLTYLAFDYIRRDKVLSLTIRTLITSKFGRGGPAYTKFMDAYGPNANTIEKKDLLNKLHKYLECKSSDILDIVDVIVSNDQKPDVLIHRAGDVSYVLQTYNLVRGPNIKINTSASDMIPGVKISYATRMDICQPAMLSYSLLRYKVYLDLTYQLNGNRGVLNLPIEIYDVALPLNSEPNFFEENGIAQNDIGMKPVFQYDIKNTPIPSITSNNNYNSISVYSLQFVIDDLIMMLFDNPPYPNTDKKYAKRIKRLMNVLLISELDRSSIKDVRTLFTDLKDYIGNIETIKDQSLNDEKDILQFDNNFAVGNMYLRKKITSLLAMRDLFHHKNTYLYKIIDPFINILNLLLFSITIQKNTKTEQSVMLNSLPTIDDGKSNLIFKLERDYIYSEVFEKEWNFNYICEKSKSAIVNKSVFISSDMVGKEYVQSLSRYFNDLRQTVIDIINNIVLPILSNLN